MRNLLKLANKFERLIAGFPVPEEDELIADELDDEGKFRVVHNEALHGKREKPVYMSDEEWAEGGQKYPIENQTFTREQYERAPFQHSLGGIPPYLQAIINDINYLKKLLGSGVLKLTYPELRQDIHESLSSIHREFQAINDSVSRSYWRWQPGQELASQPAHTRKEELRAKEQFYREQAKLEAIERDKG